MKQLEVYKFQMLDTSNGRYNHPTHNAVGVIRKDGMTIKLTEEEIKKVVFAFGGNFKA